MSDLICPGCNGRKYATDLCCGDCWNRIPRDLRNWPYWRTKLKSYRATKYWFGIEKIIDEARSWLVAHPKKVKTHR